MLFVDASKYGNSSCLILGVRARLALQVMQDELQKLALKVNHHEENIRFLKSELNAVEDSCADLGSEILMPCDTLLLYILLIYGFVVIFVYSSNAIYRYHDAE